MICVSVWTFRVLSWGRGILKFYTVGWGLSWVGGGLERSLEQGGAGKMTLRDVKGRDDVNVRPF